MPDTTSTKPLYSAADIAAQQLGNMYADPTDNALSQAVVQTGPLPEVFPENLAPADALLWQFVTNLNRSNHEALISMLRARREEKGFRYGR